MSSALDEALETLYAGSPATFTKTRDELAKALAKSGDAAAAADLKNRKKPGAVAYVLNQLARRCPDDVAALIDVGRALARAQRSALRGDKGPDLRAVVIEQRKIVSALTQKTSALLRELGMAKSAHLDDIARALHAAMIDPSVGAAFEAGRLEAIPESGGGFPTTTGDADADDRVASAPVARAKEESHAKKGRDADAAKAAEERERKEAAEKKARAIHEAKVREAKKLAHERAAEAKAADEKATQLESEAARLEASAKRAVEAAHDARKKSRALESAAAEAARDAERIERVAE